MFTMQSLYQDLQPSENGIDNTMTAKTQSFIILNLSGTQIIRIVRTGSVYLECTLAYPLDENIVFILSNQFEARP